MRELTKTDVTWCIRRLGKTLATFMKRNEGKVFLAGGFIRSCIANENINDVDFFVPDSELAKQFAYGLAENSYVHETEFAYTVTNQKYPVQFVHKWTYDHPTDVVPDFDFTIARAVIWYEDEEFHSQADERFYQDLASKRLEYCAPDRDELAGGSMLRILKFYQRGYRIPMESLGRVISRMVKEIDPNRTDFDNEVEVGKVITGMLREVDPAIDPEHLTH